MNAARLALLVAAAALAACASYSAGLVRGQSTADDVLRTMGPPAQQWTNADGSRQFAYPRGPMGVHTHMIFIDRDGRLQRIDNVLDEDGFAHVRPGMTQDEVLRTLGPPWPGWTAYFKARDELVWEWRYCDVWSQYARFHVLFDATRGTVRSTLSLRESQTSQCGDPWGGGCWCGR